MFKLKDLRSFIAKKLLKFVRNKFSIAHTLMQYIVYERSLNYSVPNSGETIYS
jgi:hypothetical protein